MPSYTLVSAAQRGFVSKSTLDKDVWQKPRQIPRLLPRTGLALPSPLTSLSKVARTSRVEPDWRYHPTPQVRISPAGSCNASSPNRHRERTPCLPAAPRAQQDRDAEFEMPGSVSPTYPNIPRTLRQQRNVNTDHRPPRAALRSSERGAQLALSLLFPHLCRLSIPIAPTNFGRYRLPSTRIAHPVSARIHPACARTRRAPDSRSSLAPPADESRTHPAGPPHIKRASALSVGTARLALVMPPIVPKVPSASG